MKPVSLSIRWAELFGENPKDISPEDRRKRWEEWKVLAIEDGGQQVVDYWARDNIDECCFGCKHHDGDWCKYSELPCCVNPVLTFRENIIGMACCGVGFEPGQLKMF